MCAVKSPGVDYNVNVKRRPVCGRILRIAARICRREIPCCRVCVCVRACACGCEFEIRRPTIMDYIWQGTCVIIHSIACDTLRSHMCGDVDRGACAIISAKFKAKHARIVRNDVLANVTVCRHRVQEFAECDRELGALIYTVFVCVCVCNLHARVYASRGAS